MIINQLSLALASDWLNGLFFPPACIDLNLYNRQKRGDQTDLLEARNKPLTQSYKLYQMHTNYIIMLY